MDLNWQVNPVKSGFVAKNGFWHTILGEANIFLTQI
jgi:hypothetical protein